MSEDTRITRFNEMLKDLDDREKHLPPVQNKYMGLTVPFPQTLELQNQMIESIERLIHHDPEVCIAVHFTSISAINTKYNEVIFIGNDYLHLMSIRDFMKGHGIESSISPSFILYREYADDLNRNFHGKHTRVTSVNDIFSLIEIYMTDLDFGKGYQYENRLPKKDIIHYCACNRKEDEEGKVLGNQLFIQSLSLYSKLLLINGFRWGYPVVDTEVHVLDAKCQVCYYRDYYFILSAMNTLQDAMKRANWRLCEPLMEIRISCTKQYMEENSFINETAHLQWSEDREHCKAFFQVKISNVISCLEEFYSDNQNIFDFNIKMVGYVPVELPTVKCNGFKIINDIGAWKEDIN
ncbi:elongation factor G [Paenibacillus sp. SI8]|uniref:elongation factor G n=1 Tax=unclassified Paenibacillus TaxID=185978 RepID=UPI0034669FAB